MFGIIDDDDLSKIYLNFGWLFVEQNTIVGILKNQSTFKSVVVHTDIMLEDSYSQPKEHYIFLLNETNDNERNHFLGTQITAVSVLLEEFSEDIRILVPAVNFD